MSSRGFSATLRRLESCDLFLPAPVHSEFSTLQNLYSQSSVVTSRPNEHQTQWPKPVGTYLPDSFLGAPAAVRSRNPINPRICSTFGIESDRARRRLEPRVEWSLSCTDQDTIEHPSTKPIEVEGLLARSRRWSLSKTKLVLRVGRF